MIIKFVVMTLLTKVLSMMCWLLNLSFKVAYVVVFMHYTIKICDFKSLDRPN